MTSDRLAASFDLRARRASSWICLTILVVAMPHLRAEDVRPRPPIRASRAAVSPASQVTTFDLRVVGPDGKPISRAKAAFRSTPSIEAAQVRRGAFVDRSARGLNVNTDSDGRITLDRPRDLRHLEVLIEIPGFAPYLTNWDLDRNSEPIPAELTAKLKPGSTFGGIVVDDVQKPIAGAAVRLSIEPTIRPDECGEPTIEATVRSDAAGRWTYDSVPASADDLGTTIEKAGFETSRAQLARAEFGLARGRAPSALNPLSPATVVTGKITDEAGKPIGGAIVRARYADRLCQAVTGADGTYRLVDCESGDSIIVVWAKGRATDLRQVQVETDTHVDFRMKPGRTICVRVLDERGNAIPRAQIVIQNWRDQEIDREIGAGEQYTDSQGVWEWKEAPEDQFLVDICRPDGMRLANRPLLARADEYVFRVPRALVISGKVVAAETGQPIKRFHVICGNRAGAPQPVWNNHNCFTAIDGQYRLRETEERLAHLVHVDADGYLPAVSREIKSDEGNVAIDFALTKANEIEGTVLTSAGVPAARATVALGAGGSQVVLYNGKIQESVSCPRRTTDDFGHFHFPPEIVEHCLVVTHATGYALLRCAPNHDPKIIRLTPWARLEGTYRVAREARAGALIALGYHGKGISGIADEAARSVNLIYRQTTDANGRFVFEHVAPGQGSVGRQLPWTNAKGWTPATSAAYLPVTFLPGKTTQLEFGIAGRPVIGQFRRAPEAKQNIAWSFVLVNVEADVPQRDRHGSLFFASVDRGGNFCIDDVPPGRYLLSVSDPAGGSLRRRPFTVPAIKDKLSQKPVDVGVITLKPEVVR
jgi:hypothetical protein